MRAASAIRTPAHAGLPPLSVSEAQAVLVQAEQAAIAQALGAPPQANPHPPGTRAHILWEAHHGAVLMDWTQ